MVTRVRRHRREPRWWPQQTALFRRPQPRPGWRRRLRAPQRKHCHSGSRTGRGAGSAGGKPGLPASRGDPDADRELSLSKMGTSGDRAIKATAGIARRPAAGTDRDQPLAGGYRSVKHDDPASHVSTKRASPRPFRSEARGENCLAMDFRLRVELRACRRASGEARRWRLRFDSRAESEFSLAPSLPNPPMRQTSAGTVPALSLKPTTPESVTETATATACTSPTRAIHNGQPGYAEGKPRKTTRRWPQRHGMGAPE